MAQSHGMGRQAEACNQYLTKGSCVEIAGSIHYTKWEDRETGQMRYGVEEADLSSDLSSQPEPEPAAPVIEQPKKRQHQSKVAGA